MCGINTEKSCHRFTCTLTEHGPDEPHRFWLAAPVCGTVPLWTAKTLIEDDWSDA